MAINNPAFSSDSVDGLQNFRLELQVNGPQPDISPGNVLDPPEMPNRLFGWYNGATDMVELFMTNSTGTRYIRVASYDN